MTVCIFTAVAIGVFVVVAVETTSFEFTVPLGCFSSFCFGEFV
jgi:hypothetical protein